MGNKDDKITCVIFLYNEEKFIEEALRSVVNQSFPVDEIVVCDDYSTDNTANIVKELALNNPKIKYVLSEKKGKFHAYKTGLKQVRTKFFFIMAGDDGIERNYVEDGLNFIGNKNLDFFYSNAYVCNSNLEKVQPKNKKGETFDLTRLLFRNWAGGFLFGKSKIISEILEISNEKITFEDWVCVIKLAHKYGKLVLSDKPSYLYRRHSNATTIKLDAHKLRGRDIMLYKYLLESSGIPFSAKELKIIKSRLVLHKFFRKEINRRSTFFKLLLNDSILNSEKVKISLVLLFGSEERVNQVVQIGYLKMKKKILLINDFRFAGGAETVFLKTAELIQGSNKFQIDIFYGAENYRKANGILEYLYSKNTKNRLKRELHDTKPDIIHIHGYYHILSPSIFTAIKKFKKRNEVKVIYTAHDYHFLYPNSSLLRYKNGKSEVSPNIGLSSIFDKVDHRGTLYSWAKKIQWVLSMYMVRSKNQIDKFVSPSIFLAELYQKHLGKEVVLVRNPMGNAPNRPTSGIGPNEKLRLIYFGRLSAEKGLLNFISQIPADHDQSFLIDIYGTGEQKQKISNLIDNRGLSKIIKLHGYKDHAELLKILPSYHAMVIPSVWYENAPMSIVEAAKAGLYIIGSDIGGVAELSKVCGNYVLFDPENFSFSDLLVKIKNLKPTNRDENLKVFSEESYLNALIEVYE